MFESLLSDRTRVVTVPHAEDQQEPVEFTLQGRAADGSNIGPVSRATIRFQQPDFTLTPIAGCLNAQVADAEVGGGFEIIVQATGQVS